jgi:hypothetical protein
MIVNKFIDWHGLFNEIVSEQEEWLQDDMETSDHEKNIYKFYKDKENLSFEVQYEECAVGDDEVCFVFGLEHQTTNESYNHNEWESVHIIYDRHSEMFSYYRFEQG